MQLLRGRTTRTRSLAVSPDSRYVAAAGAVTCHVWDLHNPKAKPQALESRINFIRSLQFTTSNDLIAWVGAQWRCYSVAAGYAEWFEFPVDTETDSSIFHPTGTLLKNRARLGSVDTYDLTIRNSATLTNTREIANLQYLRRFNPAGDRYLAVVDMNECLVDNATDSILTTFDTSWNEPDDVTDCYFSSDGKRLYFWAEWELFAYDCAAGGPAVATAALPIWCHSLAAHPDGRLLATVEDGRAVTFRDADTLEVLRRYDFNMPTVTCVAFTPDGTRCVIGNSRGKVLLFDVE